MKNLKPWLDEKGSPLCDSRIKIVSKKWDEKTWESYAEAVVDGLKNENEILRHDYEVICDETQDSIWGPSCSLPEMVSREIYLALEKIGPRKSRIVRKYFWKNYSLRKLAASEGLSVRTVRDLKSESLREIRDLLMKSPHTSSYLIEGYEVFEDPKNRNASIRSAYKADLEGSYLNWSHGRKKLNCAR